MTTSELNKKIGVLRTELQRQLNNIYIWTSFSRSALEHARESQDFLTQKRFIVPSNARSKEVERTADQLREIADRAVEKEIYFSVFVYAVAQVEAFVGDLLYELLRFDARRLKIKIKGIDHISKIDVTEIIDSGSREELIESLIQRELTSLFYAAPSLQMQYFQAVTGVKLDDRIVAGWIEIKATRDIIVHNSGISNSIYLRKAGDLARAKEGQPLPMNDKYFEGALAIMKSFVGKVTSAIQSDLKKGEKVTSS